MPQQAILFFIGTLLTVSFGGCNQSPPAAPQATPMDSTPHIRQLLGEDFFVEEDAILRIQKAESDEQRMRLIAELDSIPVGHRPFYDRWLAIHQIDPYACWTDDGYREDASPLPREIQWMEVTTYGIADIENGGLHQFFGNGTGRFAPEMALWFDQAGLPESATILRKAMGIFGADFPRSQAKRNEFLAGVPGAYEGRRADWDPFDSLDEQFSNTLTGATRNDIFDAACDRWLRERCGISKLSDSPPTSVR